ncbi:MAG: hypothetical protein PVG89_10800 [Gammaproteobacteria bacterium]|jgi:hypothetical protein
MSGINRYIQMIIVTALIILITGCGTVQRHYDRNVDETGKPQWVVHGTQTSKTSQGRVFLGVGVVNTQGDFSREASTANNRAREEVAGTVARFIEVAVRDYMASGNAEPAGFLPNEAPHYIDAMTQLVMPHAKVMEHWVDSEHHKIFAIAEIDYPQVQTVLYDSPKVHRGFKTYLNQHGEQVFDRIATQH